MKFLCPNCKAKYRIGPEKLLGRQVAKIRCRKCDYRIQLTPRPGSDEYDITATPTSIAPPPSGAAKSSAAARAGIASEAPARSLPLPRVRADVSEREEPPATKKPTAAVPGLPGLGTSKIARGVVGREGGGGASLARRSGGPAGTGGISAGRLPALGLPPVPLPPPPPSAVPGLSSSRGSSAMAAFPPIAAATAPAALASPEPRFEAAAPLATPPLPPQPAAIAAQAVAPPPGPAPARPGTGGTQLADQFRQSVQAGGSGNGPDDGPQDGWFVGVNGVPLGPIPIGDLKELAAAGHVDRRSLVWREGQAEWRPLGKFPQLARLLEDSGVSSVSQARPVVAAREAEPSHSNGSAAAPLATGFDLRPPSSPEAQRPSAWGDLDEDDDEEQPTTVKGRVSGLPPIPASGSAFPGGSLAVPFANESFLGAGGPVAFEGAAGNASGLARPADRAAAMPIPSPSSTSLGISPPASLPVELGSADLGSADLEAGGLRGNGRGRIYAFVIVAVASLALGWTLRHVLWSGGDSEPAKPPASAPGHSQSSPQPSDRRVKAARAQNSASESSAAAPGRQDPLPLGARAQELRPERDASC